MGLGKLLERTCCALPLFLSLAACSVQSEALPPSQPIDRYIDAARYLRRGAAYGDPSRSPVNFGYDPYSLDQLRDYRFADVDQLETELAGVDRQAVLRGLFLSITLGAQTDIERQQRVSAFLHEALLHNVWQPLYPDGSIVSDPLVLLELGEARCGHIARIAADLFAANGYSSRLVQLGGHVIAEIYYDDSWHYLDANVFGNGEAVRIAGVIPSIEELSDHPEMLDRLLAYPNPDWRGGPATDGSPYPSNFYFGQSAYIGYLPMYYSKIATLEQLANFYFGWDELDIVVAPNFINPAVAPRWAPSPPRWLSVQETSGAYRLFWDASVDFDGDLRGYRVFLSATSRGWEYELLHAAQSVSPFVQLGWDRTMYRALFEAPPSDLGRLETTDTFIDLPPWQGELYVSVLAFDDYGEQIGRQRYHLSNELRLQSPSNRSTRGKPIVRGTR